MQPNRILLGRADRRCSGRRALRPDTGRYVRAPRRPCEPGRAEGFSRRLAGHRLADSGSYFERIQLEIRSDGDDRGLLQRRAWHQLWTRSRLRFVWRLLATGVQGDRRPALLCEQIRVCYGVSKRLQLEADRDVAQIAQVLPADDPG